LYRNKLLALVAFTFIRHTFTIAHTAGTGPAGKSLYCRMGKVPHEREYDAMGGRHDKLGSTRRDT